MIGESLGSYRIVRELGAGGMGVVYYAEHPMIGKRAAIKLLRAELSKNVDIVNRFFNEAKAVTTINHPGLVDVYDFGFAGDGSAYIVMEFLDGESLGSKLRRDGRLPFEFVVAIMRQLAGALGAAHAHKIVHRDLKPDNLFLSPDPDVPLGIRAKVLDFGIAKLAPPELGGDREATPHTKTGMLMGTPLYMAPEQCRGAGAVDRRADIYALGVILYEMVCGQPPFMAEGMGEIIAKHQYEAPVPPRHHVPNVPPHLEALILRMLDKKPEARPQTMEEVAASIDRTSKEMAIAKPLGHTTLSGAAAEALPPRKRSRLGVVLGAGTLVAVGATIAIVAATRSPEDAATEVAKPAPPIVKPEPKPEPATPPPAPPPIAELAKAAAPATPAPKVTLTIASVPPGAEVYRAFDGVRLGVTPFAQKLDRVDGQAVYLLKLPQYVDERVELDAGKDDARSVTLTPVRTPRPPVTAPPPPVHSGPQAVDPFAPKGK